jgi:hypothetical protein
MKEKLSDYLNRRPTKYEPEKRPDMPSHCGVDGCKGPCHVLTVCVKDDQGINHYGAWSTFSRDHNYLREGYSFVAWIPRCDKHL